MRVKNSLTSAAQGEPLTAAAIDAYKTFRQPQVVVPTPCSAQPGPQGLIWDRSPKSIVVGGM